MTGRGPKAGERLAVLVLVVGAVVVALIAAELFVRAAPTLFSPKISPATHGPTAPEGAPQLEIRDLVRPGAQGWRRGAWLENNSGGFRGPESPEKKPDDRFRIVVVGDSIAMGDGVANDESYAARLQEHLDDRAGRGRFEVLNFGIAGMALRHVVGRLQNRALAYDPDLVVYGFTPNDIEGPGYVPETRAEADAFRRELLRFADSPSRLLRLVWPRLVVLRDLIRPFPGSYTAVLRRNYFDNSRAWKRFETELDALAAVGRQRDVCVHVLVHTSLVELNALHPWKEIYGRVEEAVLARGMTVTQTLPTLKGRRARELVVSPVDPHPNAAGHRILAQALFAGLAELPANCGLELSSETTAPAR